MKKNIRNVKIIVRKLRPVSIRVTNYKLDVTSKKKPKRGKIVKK